jgi:hypothetical protein
MSRTVINVTTGETTVVEWTAEELAGFQICRAEENVNRYRRDRANAYPPASDYLDGIVKGDAGQVQAYIAACLAVKAKYPKP